MNIKIKNMKDFNGLLFFELVIDDRLGVRGFKIALDSDGEYELILPQIPNRKVAYKNTSVIYDEKLYDEILEKALKEALKLNGSNEVIK